MSLVLDIKKRYPGFTLDMQLEGGEERVALLGASGCPARAAHCAALPVWRRPTRARSLSTA